MPRVPDPNGAPWGAIVARGATSLALVLGVGVWVGVGAAPWLAGHNPVGRSLEPAQLAGPLAWWTDGVARAGAREALRAGSVEDVERAQALLRHSLRVRPLYAPTWLVRAKASLRLGARPEAARWAMLSRTLWPNRERHLWRVALVQGMIGPAEPALRTLRDVLRMTSAGVGLAAHQAGRLEPDAARRAEALLPDPAWPLADTRAYLERLLHLAARDRDVVLAARAWDALSAESRERARFARRYVDLLIEVGRLDVAQQIWRAVDPSSGADRIGNPGFEMEITHGGFGWQLIDRPRVHWRRDRWVRVQGHHSLRIDFSGVVEPYRHFFQRVLVRSGARYRLRARWRGQDVSAHARAYLHVTEHGSGASLVRSRPRSGSWAWADVEIEFSVPAHVQVVEVRLQRDARPKRIATGQIWLDEFALERIARSTRDRHG